VLVPNYINKDIWRRCLERTVMETVKSGSSQISIEEATKRELENRREELFAYYREKSGYSELIAGRRIGKINVEDGKRNLPLSSILPKQIISFEHTLPLKILAFSDYEVHDFKPLLEYVKKLEKKPDIIVYAGDGITRFGTVPLTPDCLYKRKKYPPIIESVRFSDENCKSFPSFGFILRLPKKLEIDIKDKIKQIKEAYSVIKAFNKSNSSSLEILKNLIQESKIKIEILIRKIKPNIISLVDAQTRLEIYRFRVLEGKLYPADIIPFDYDDFYEQYKDVDLDKLHFIRSDSDEKYVYYLIPNPKQPEQSEENILEELAKHARYGVVAVLGNEDRKAARAWIRGEKVYELFTSLVKIGPVVIAGLEGSTCGLGPNGGYLESDIKLRLEFIQKYIAKDELILIVSHAPPRGILDRAIRFGERSIGSIALRDFIEEESRVGLVVCGHVHSCGGSFETLNNATIVNVSSHDDPFSKANIAWIIVNKEGKVQVNMEKLPSLVEQIISENGQDVKEKLKNKCYLSDAEADLLVSYAKKSGIAFLDHLSEIAKIKYRYGLPWDPVLMLYEKGIKDITQINEQIFVNMYPYIPGIYHSHWKRAYAKFKRERSNEIYLMNPLLINSSKLILFDTEYNPEMGVLYGFLDFSENEIKQFWFDEKQAASEFVRLKMREGYIFVYWGGADKTLLRNELGVNPQMFNLLYYCQTSLVAPLNSTTLRDVHDALCGHVNDEWWKNNFYDIDGIYKLMLCNTILREPANASARKSLLEANKADILALAKILKALTNLPIKPSEALSC
jgi:Icc-related predicted phosphoesterase